MHPSEELWISRAIDRTATAEDWRGIAAIAAEDRDVWQRLGVTLREDALLGSRLGAVLPPPAAPLLATLAAAKRSSLATGPVGPLGLLLATAAIAIVFCLGRASVAARDPAPAVTAAAGAPPAATPADADRLLTDWLAASSRDGSLLEQLPLRTIASRRPPDGDGVEVVFVRSFVERRRVDRAVAVAADEYGRPTPLAVDLAHYFPPTDY